MALNLKRGSLVGMILAKTLNDCDAVHRGEATFFVRSPLRCVSSLVVMQPLTQIVHNSLILIIILLNQHAPYRILYDLKVKE